MWSIWVGLALAGPVDDIFVEAESFMPADFSNAMTATEAFGPVALPDLVRLVKATDSEYRLFALCSAIERLETPNADVVDALAVPLVHKSDLARSVCGRAMAVSLVEPSPMLRKRMAEDAACDVRVSIASGMRVGAMCELYDHYAGLSQCERRVAVKGWAHCADGEGKLVAFVSDVEQTMRVREAALFSLRDMEGARSPALLALARKWVEARGQGNIHAVAAEVLGRVGTRDDLPRLEAMVAADPNGREGYHADRAQKAVVVIRGRLAK